MINEMAVTQKKISLSSSTVWVGWRPIDSKRQKYLANRHLDGNVNFVARFPLLTQVYSNNPMLFGSDIYLITKVAVFLQRLSQTSDAVCSRFSSP